MRAPTMTGMERDDKILQALAEGPAGSVELATRTGLPLATLKRGLRQLRDGDYIFKPGRVYRLTARGRAVSPEPAPPAGPAKAASPAVAPAPPKHRLDVTL